MLGACGEDSRAMPKLDAGEDVWRRFAGTRINFISENTAPTAAIAANLAPFEKLTGIKGIFSTRIAFVTKQGNRYKLNIADWDGQNVQTALNSGEPIISPTWSPDGTRLAYVSFEARKPVVYVHNLASGQRKAVAEFRGSNSAPAWSLAWCRWRT